MDARVDHPTILLDQRQNIVASNALGRALYALVIGDGGRTPNLARFQFLDPASRDCCQ